MNINIRNGNVIDELKKIPDESVDCVVSSPPYFTIPINMVWILHCMGVDSTCIICNKKIHRRGSQIGKFCSLNCKGIWQHQQLPVTKEWLEQKYILEGMSTYQIANLVHRNPKRVYEWLKEAGIPTRSRGETLSKNSYGRLVKSGKAPNTFKGKKHTNETKRILSIKASVPKPYLRGENNGMYGVRGSNNPNWQGGSTPDRQQYYSSIEWKKAVKSVWKRDSGICQRCGVKHPFAKFHIHHIISFIYKETRNEPTNLVLLCDKCHRWVHSNRNKNKEWIKRMPVKTKILGDLQ